MIGRLLGAMGVVLLGAMATTAAVQLLLSYSEPVGGVCEAVRVGGPTLAIGSALLVLIAPLLLRRWKVKFLSRGRLVLTSITLAVALPLTAVGLVVSGALVPSDPFAGQSLPFANASLAQDLPQPLELRFQGKAGQIFTTVQSSEVLSNWAVSGCDPRPATTLQSFRQIVEQTVEKVAANGRLTIRQRWPQAELRSVHNGQTQIEIDSAMPSEEGEEIDLLSVTLHAEQYPDGRLKILNVEGAGTGVDRARSILETAEIQDASMLPEVSVRPGDKWRLGQRRFAIPTARGRSGESWSGGSVTYTPEATFSGLTTQDGRRLAVIDLVARDIDLASDEDRQLVTILKRFMIKGRIVWDPALGRPLSETTLVEFLGQTRTSDHRSILLHVQATLQTVETP